MIQPKRIGMFSAFRKFFASEPDPREARRPLWDAVVATARAPHWYAEGSVPDTLDGRFDVLAALVALVLLRLEADGDSGKGPSVLLTEVFIDDMEATLRQIGIGDYVVGKHLGKMVSALGGRLAAFRGVGLESEAFAAAVRRNVFHETPPSEEAAVFVGDRLAEFRQSLDRQSSEALFRGEL